MMERHIRGLLTALPILVVGLGGWAAGPAYGLTAQDRAGALGISVSSITQGRNPVFDADGDGFADDILVNRHNAGVSTLYRGNANGSFTKLFDFTKDDRHGCVPGDFGAPGGLPPDGRMDFFCTLGSCSGREPGACGGRVFNRELWLRQPDGTFVDQGIGSGADHPSDRGRDVTPLDSNGDGLRDLATAAEGNPSGNSLNRLYRNLGNAHFAEVMWPGRRNAGSECVVPFQRAAGRIDLLYCADRGTTGGTGLLHFRHDGGTAYTEITASTAYRALVTRDLEVNELTGDGQPDLVIQTPANVQVWANVGGAFPRATYTFAVNNGVDVAACDVDRDGDRDLYVATGTTNSVNQPDALLLNDGTGRFTSFPNLPRTTLGGGDEVTCVTDRQSGPPAVLVANGRFQAPGPYQFIVFQP